MGLSDTPVNRAAAEAKAAEIQRDLAFHQFDSSLEKYRPKQFPKIVHIGKLFQQWIDHKLNDGIIAKQTALSLYRTLQKLLDKYPVKTQKQAEKLFQKIAQKRNPTSANQALCLYKAFGDWAVENKYMSINPFKHIKSLRAIRSDNKRQPFTPDEISKLLATMAADDKLSHYHDFCFLLFSLGLRPSEAIGLRWKSVDLENKKVTISEALVRCDGQRQERKGTKNNVVRTLKLSESLSTILQARRPTNPNPDDLVFKSIRGNSINSTTFRRFYWKPALELAGIPYRPPYTARHTLISYGIEIGWSLPQAAQVAGDSVATIVSNYAHPINPPSMPDWSEESRT